MTDTQIKLFEHFTPFRHARLLGKNSPKSHVSTRSTAADKYPYMVNRSKIFEIFLLSCCARTRKSFVSSLCLSNVCIVSSSGVDIFIALHPSFRRCKTVNTFSAHKGTHSTTKSQLFFSAFLSLLRMKQIRCQQHSHSHDFLPFRSPSRSIDGEHVCLLLFITMLFTLKLNGSGW